MEPAASTSSASPATSKSWEATISLGERIIAEFSIESHGDTLGRWMAHRVAELMQQSKGGGAAAEAVKTACADLIFRLWEHREQMGRSRPLSEAIDSLHQLSAPQTSRRPRPAGKKATWASTFAEIQNLHRREIAVWQNATVVDIDPAAARGWMKEGGDNLSDAERAIAQNVINVHNMLDQGVLFLEGGALSKDDPAKRLESFRAMLAEISKQREALLARLFGPVKKPAEHSRKSKSPPTKSKP